MATRGRGIRQNKKCCIFVYLLQNSFSMQRMCLDGGCSFAIAKKAISHSACTAPEMLPRSMRSILEHSYALRLQKVWLLLRNQLSLAMRFSLIVCAKSVSKPDSNNVCSHKSSAALEWPYACFLAFGKWSLVQRLRRLVSREMILPTIHVLMENHSSRKAVLQRENCWSRQSGMFSSNRNIHAHAMKIAFLKNRFNELLPSWITKLLHLNFRRKIDKFVDKLLKKKSWNNSKHEKYRHMTMLDW